MCLHRIDENHMPIFCQLQSEYTSSCTYIIVHGVWPKE